MDVRVINELVHKQSAFIDKLNAEVGKVIVGQKAMLERILIGLLTGGHVLLEGVPGLAKTLTVRTLSDVLAMKFQRIQFTPDLLPADIVGTVIYNQARGEFVSKQGPIFANLVLADEINRAPAKVQSALLEAMQERQVTIGDTTHKLPDPFLVMATQNPIEQEGTYALPEAQLDRFMLMIKVGYPTREEERAIMDRMTSPVRASAERVATPQEIAEARSVVNEIYIDEKIRDYIVSIVHASREPKAHGFADLADFIAFGASPRASIYLNMAARAHAFLRHRGYVTPEDIKAIGVDVLRHRVILTYEAEAEDVTAETVVRKLFERVEVP
ncbi:MAG TPA: AAA family ATPase [Polyangia bacterium]|jgi:MoxR-like ATPase